MNVCMDGWIDRWLLDEAVLKWRESCPYSACQLVSLTQNKPGLYPITPSEPSHTLQWELLVMHVYASLFFYFLRMHSWYAVHSHISVFDWVLCKCVQPHISAFGLNAFSVVSCFGYLFLHCTGCGLCDPTALNNSHIQIDSFDVSKLAQCNENELCDT